MTDSVWIDVPLGDYEAHMQSTAVAQLAVLAELFTTALQICQPRSVAILGVAGGNGLDAIDPVRVTRVVGIDVNPQYLRSTAVRYGDRLPLDLQCIDLSRDPVTNVEPVDLVHAALIFEHAGTGRALDTAIELVAPSGHLAVVLQLPSNHDAPAPPSGFTTIERVRGASTLVERDAFVATLVARHFTMVHEDMRPVASAKALWFGVFARIEA